MEAELISTAMDRRQFLQRTALAAGTLAVSASAPWAGAQTPGQPLTMAFVGCAHIHTPSFVNLLAKERKEVKVKYVWDHDTARADKRAKELSARTVASPAQIWADKEVSAVVICSETTRHKELVLAGAAAGKHMFVEKPLGVTARESATMARAIEKAGVLFTTGYFMRTHGQLLFLREQVQKGVFGKITRVRGSNCHSGSLGGWFDTDWRWMADPAIAGVGAFGDLGTHSLDILMWMFGDVESIIADIKVVTGRYGKCDETGEALIRFKNGITGTLAAGWVDVADPVTLLISGTEGHAVISRGELYFQCKKAGADGKTPWTQYPTVPPLPLHQFVNAVQGAKDMPLVTPREAAARVSVMEAAYQSMGKRAWVKPV
jgi:predicted dehydrogenase